MNKQQAQELRQRVVAAIEPIVADYGLVLRPSTMRFDDQGFSLPLKGEDPNAEIPEWLLDSFGLPAGTQRGVEFTYGNDRYRFDGIAANRPKYPINATKLGNGKQYKLPAHAADYIAKALEKEDR